VSSDVPIAFYCDSREVGGAETSLRNLLGALAGWVDATVMGVDPDVVDWLAGGRPGSRTLVLPEITSKWHPKPIAEHIRVFRRLQPRILHVSLSDPWASHWALLAGICTPRVRVVAVEQSTWRTRSLRRRALKRLTGRGVAALVAVGAASAEAAASFSGVPRERIRVIHNGVPDEAVAPLARLGPSPVIGSVGRLEEEKGFDMLLRALADVPGATAVLVGDGSRKPELAKLADQLGVSARVVFTGWSDEPRRHLTTFDLYVLPSRVEGFPLAVVEAMLAGLPVVASTVGSVADAVLDGETGLLVPAENPEALASAIGTLLADPDRMREMGNRGREVARRQFTARAMAARFESLYEELLG
jgi:glycosyltransferase involved in cell wall biosynthesis